MPSTLLAAKIDVLTTYHQLVDPVFNSDIGNIITKLFAAVALVIIIGLIAGGVFKMMGRPNQLTQVFCPDIKRIIVMLVVAFICGGPTVTFPLCIQLFQYAVNGIGQTGFDYLTGA